MLQDDVSGILVGALAEGVDVVSDVIDAVEHAASHRLWDEWLSRAGGLR